jgi:transcriptional regulator, gntR family
LNFIISNNSDVPIYQQIKNEIINSISNNDLKENDMLPSIRNLAKDLRISILTVKKPMMN